MVWLLGLLIESLLNKSGMFLHPLERGQGEKGPKARCWLAADRGSPSLKGPQGATLLSLVPLASF